MAAMNVRTLIENAGLPRRRFTVKEVERMSEVGLLRAEEDRKSVV